MIKLIVLRHGQSSLNHENIFCGWIDAELTAEGLSQAANASNLIYDHLVSVGEGAAESRDESLLPTVGFASRLVRTNQTILQIVKTLQERSSAENHAFDRAEEYHVVESKRAGDGPEVEFHPKRNGGADEDKDKEKDAGAVFNVFESWRLNERHYGSWQGQRKPAVLQKYGKEEYMRIRRDYHGTPPVVDLSKEMEPDSGAGSPGVEGNGVPMAASGSELVYDFKEPNRRTKYFDEHEYGTHVSLPVAESLGDVIARLEPYLYGFILPRVLATANKTGLIVAHGSSVRSMLKVLCGISETEIKNVEIPNGIPLIVELDDQFNFLRRYYLDPEQAKIKAAKVRNEGFQ